MYINFRACIRWYAWRVNPLNWLDLFSRLDEPPKPPLVSRRKFDPDKNL